MKTILSILALIVTIPVLLAQNPLIMDQFTADPSARVFKGKVFVYPSHDIRIDTGRFATWFCMEDYHVFSSENLTQWHDHGVILRQQDVPWVDASSYSMWAPDCIEKNGKYYFYFPSIAKDKSVAEGRRIGVAISDSPTGPFSPLPKPIPGVYGIDPNLFVDHDGNTYIFWAMGGELLGARLKDNMIELASEPKEITTLPDGFKEGPWLFHRNGLYYLTFPHVAKNTERLAYAMGRHPLGPFEYKGVIMDESPVDCWTNHHSIIEYKGQWLLFYHHNDLSPHFDKNRSIKADSLFFNADGTIHKVKPSLRGVGITPADRPIQVDRFSLRAEEGVATAFVDSLHPQKGWFVSLINNGAWVKYNKVEFKNHSWKKMIARVRSQSDCSIEIRNNSFQGEMLAKLNVPKGNSWDNREALMMTVPQDVSDLFIVLSGDGPVAIDWIRFE
ncbi:family 43 glycosylhydrolase [Thermophagus sp. OGC60D27]|uniref:family 43 glycosylhydrolase n=1 Tax=Thermophagus sp. OGC60D27 TaxID=3458415 RepID=UPI00403768AD